MEVAVKSVGAAWRGRSLALGAAAIVIPTAAAVMAAGVVGAEETTTTETEFAATAQCELEELTFPDDAVFSYTSGISPDGDYVSGYFSVDPVETNREAVVWHDDEAHSLGIPDEATAYAVNDSGLAVGQNITPDWEIQPYVAQDGEATQVPGIRHGSATGVNDGGDVVGERNDNWLESEPFVWRDGADEVEDLPAPDGAYAAVAADISDDGAIVGWYESEDHEILPYSWDVDGEGRELPLPDGLEPDADVRVHQVTGDWAVGRAGDTAVRWNLSTDAAPEELDADSAHGVSADGWVVGNDGNRAVLITDDEVVELPSLGTNPRPARASGISADGTIISGHIDHPDVHEFVPVAWRC